MLPGFAEWLKHQPQEWAGSMLSRYRRKYKNVACNCRSGRFKGWKLKGFPKK